MMMNPYLPGMTAEVSGQPGYEADAAVVPALHKLRDEAHHFCRRHMHRRVRIQTITGQVYEGVIVDVDPRHVYLLVAHGQGYAHYPARPMYGPLYYNNVILPLVLFELLVITLLS